jgi:hypothetical protein
MDVGHVERSSTTVVSFLGREARAVREKVHYRQYAISGSLWALSACTTAEVAAQPRTEGHMQREAEVLLAKTEERATPIELPAQGLTLSLTATAALHELARDPARANALRIYLVFEGLAADPPPGVGYNVFFARTARDPTDVESSGYAGTLSFYHSFSSAEQRSAPAQRASALLVTRIVQPLLARGELSRALTVTIHPARPPDSGSKPRVRRVQLVGKRGPLR